MLGTIARKPEHDKAIQIQRSWLAVKAGGQTRHRAGNQGFDMAKPALNRAAGIAIVVG
jgi:hypothetical protein